jgi:quinol monooxygenase YgiN
LITATRQESGNLRFELNVSNDNPNVFWLVEYWKDGEALQTHFASEYFLKNFPLIKDLAGNLGASSKTISLQNITINKIFQRYR